MSRYDYPDLGTDPAYCDGLSEPPEFEMSDECAWCGDPMPNLDWHPYCSSQCGLYAELDTVED